MRPLKAILTFAAAAVISFADVYAQLPADGDRLSRVRDIVQSSELVMIWSQGPSTSVQNVFQKLYDLDLTQPDPFQRLVPKSRQMDSTQITGRKRLAVKAGNFLGGKFQHLVAAWASPGDSIRIIIPHIVGGTLSWTTTSGLTIPGPIIALSQAQSRIHLATGDFYGDAKEEAVLGYVGSDSSIYLRMFSFDTGLTPEPRGAIQDEKLHIDFGSGNSLDAWDIAAGDFDGDGKKEIALAFAKKLSGSNWAIYVKLYAFDMLGNLIPKATHQIMQRPYTVSEANVVVTAGDFSHDAADDIAVGISFFANQTGDDTYLYMVKASSDLNSLITNDGRRATRDANNDNEISPMSIAKGDFNQDGRDEVVMAVGGSFFVYTCSDTLLPTFRLSGGGVGFPGGFNSNRYTDSFLGIADMDADGRPEVITAVNNYSGQSGFSQTFAIRVTKVDSAMTNTTIVTTRGNEEPTPDGNEGLIRHFAIALGDFDGDRIRLGEPNHYRRTGVVQPTVILNTPPVHYDIFDSIAYDLSGCYPGFSCGFSSTYIQSMSTDTTVTTEVHEDWGSDVTITASAPGVKAKVKSTYGDKFSLKSTSSNSFTITTSRVAAGDDWIYANVYDIDFYEYPVYDSVDAVIGYFLVSIPGQPRPLWIEAKDDETLGNFFKPDHEVGNILSYRRTNTEDTSRVIVNFAEQTVGSTGSSQVSFQSSSFSENGVDSSWDSGFEVGETIGDEVDFYGIELGLEAELNGTYSYGEMLTQTVKAGRSLEMKGDFGHLSPQFGTTATYTIIPYSYWSRSGALVMDYKVPTIPTGPSTFWQMRYGGKTDPAFSLPWRFDPEKGFPLPNNDPSYRMRTRDIAISKPDPRGGDSIRIAARVRNFGLQNVTTPIPVRFYRNDPDAGGNQIGEVLIDSTLASRGTRIVSIDWVIPLAESLRTTRIYAIVDPDNNLTNEVHESNNKGWAPLVSLGAPTGIGTSFELPGEFALHQSYPNPFNPMATIRYDLPVASLVSLKVYNLLGQEIVTLADEVHAAGQNKVHFNGAGFPSGTYFYRMIATPVSNSGVRQIFTKKMLLIK